MRTQSVLFASVACALTAPAQAGVLRVATSGTPYTTIQSAVDAAIDGDTILVAPGVYAGFAIHDEALTIAVDPAGIVTTGVVTVEDTSATKNVVLASLRIVAQNGTALVARANEGSLRIVDCELRGGDAAFGPPATELGSGAYVTGSADVVLRGCTLRGGHGVDGYVWASPGADALFTRGSRLALYGCTLLGGRGGWVPSDGSYDGGNGGDGLETPDSFVLATATTFRGGDGGGGGDGDVFTPGGNGGNGGAGVRLYASVPANPPEVLTRQGTLQGGLGGPGGYWFGSPGAAGLPASVSLGRVHSPAATDVVRLGTPIVWRVGTLRAITVEAPPGTSVVLHAARDSAFKFDPLSEYALHVASPLLRRLALGVVPASGVLTRTIAVPALPSGATSATWYLQCFVAPPGAGATSEVLPVVLLAPGV